MYSFLRFSSDFNLTNFVKVITEFNESFNLIKRINLLTFKKSLKENILISLR